MVVTICYEMHTTKSAFIADVCPMNQLMLQIFLLIISIILIFIVNGIFNHELPVCSFVYIPGLFYIIISIHIITCSPSSSLCHSLYPASLFPSFVFPSFAFPSPCPF